MFDFFDFSGFPARWHCGDWSATLGWLTITSDLVIFAAYTAIPLTIALYVKRRGDVPFPHVFWLFCAFIFSCGTTHLIEAVIFWYPIYPVQGVLKCLTAVVSIAAVVATARIMPAALAVPGMAALNRQLQAEVAARGASQDELRQRTAQLQESERRLLAAQAAARIGDWTFGSAHPADLLERRDLPALRAGSGPGTTTLVRRKPHAVHGPGGRCAERSDGTDRSR